MCLPFHSLIPDSFYLSRDFLAIDMIMSEGPTACSYPGWLRKEEKEVTDQISFAIRSGILKFEEYQGKQVLKSSEWRKELHDKAWDMKFHPVLGCWQSCSAAGYLPDVINCLW
jgi:hypothetical protein